MQQVVVINVEEQGYWPLAKFYNHVLFLFFLKFLFPQKDIFPLPNPTGDVTAITHQQSTSLCSCHTYLSLAAQYYSMMKTILFLAAAIVGSTYGFSTQSSLSVETRQISTTNLSAQTNDNNDNTSSSTSRRRHFLTTAVTTGSAIFLPTLLSTNAAHASGGATAGKYTTIPIAKRRYYGRVQEAVHEFLLMGPAVIKDDLSDPVVQVSCFCFYINTQYAVV